MTANENKEHIDFIATMEQYSNQFEGALQAYLQKMQIQPKILKESMKYSLFLKGKRLRPVLMYAVLDMLGGNLHKVNHFAIAMEMVHTYSLIHDDLPAMDNANLRRGQPTNHLQFGEGQAILAGDALLSEAFSICMKEALLGQEYIQAGICLAQCAGVYGMVAGQSADIFYQNSKTALSHENLQFVHLHKTGKLLIASLLIPAYLQKASADILQNLYRFGEYFGKIFQLTDDLLDIQGKSSIVGKDVGLDAKANKLSAIAVYGEEKCKALVQEYAKKAEQILQTMPKSAFLCACLKYVVFRNK